PCSHPPPFRVRVFNQEGWREATSEQNQAAGRSFPNLDSRSKLSSLANTDDRGSKNSRRRFEHYKEEASRREEEHHKRAEALQAGKLAEREASFSRLTNSVNEGRAFIDELDHTLAVADEAERSRKLKQYGEWNENVYGRIQASINKQVDAMDSKSLNERKRTHYQKFLDTTSRKAALFRDIIIESEYDPLAPNREAIKATVHSLCDPTTRVLDKYAEENMALEGKGEAGGVALGRPMMDVEQWGAGKVEDTPIGFMARLETAGKEHAKGGAAPALSNTYASTFKLDHYNVEFGAAVVSSE
ncbi:unnamed protein product, partial [Chrysoparadoxa australica]